MSVASVMSSSSSSSTSVNGAVGSSLTPSSVSAAVQVPTFYQNVSQFWKMLCYLFTDYQGQKVWKHLPVDTFRSIIEQLHVVIENTQNFDTIRSNKDLLYHVYFACLISVKQHQTVSEFHAWENPPVLKGFHHLYKILRQLNFDMPLFAHVKEGLKI